jgi:hypothetical protein
MNKEETNSPSELVSHFKDISFNEFLVELFIITPGENGQQEYLQLLNTDLFYL